ncbi:MAG TPA: hypothetical protein VI485_19875 [Vicinamibacterales bacterium]|nr:hypothetical protein [Vicinamibacterales bacterium]
MIQRLLRTTFVAAICAVLGSSLVATQDASRVDVTGKWTFQVQTELGSGSPTVTLAQAGETLTGHYSSEALGEADLTGTVKGPDIAFSFTANAQGMTIVVTYTGTIEASNAMKGKVTLGEFGGGTFTAKR